MSWGKKRLTKEAKSRQKASDTKLVCLEFRVHQLALVDTGLQGEQHVLQAGIG